MSIAPNNRVLRATWKLVVLVVGGTVLLIGLAGLALPVLPGWVLVVAGLAILATEFAWARRLLQQARRMAETTSKRARARAHAMRARRAGQRLPPP